MKFSKPLIIVAILTLLAVGGLCALRYVGINPIHALNQARCRTGALLTHSTQAQAPDDSDTSSAASGAKQPAPKSASAERPVQATGDNLIPNAGLEELMDDNVTPQMWQHNVLSKTTATFSLAPGHNSSYAVRTDVTAIADPDGAADWYYPSVKSTGGQYYVFTDAYWSNVTTRPVLMIHHTTGVTDYINLKEAPASSNWATYSLRFFVPTDADQIMVFHPLAAKGTLVTDDYSLVPARATGFSEPLVSITFDDGWKSIAQNGLPLLKRYNFVSTQYLISGYLGQAISYMTPADVYSLVAAGNEVGSHTVNHLDLTKVPDQTVSYEMTQSKQDLGTCFTTPTDYAAPYGTYDQVTDRVASGLYQTARSTDTGFNTADNLDAYSLEVQNVAKTTTQQQLNDWLTIAKQNHAWLILVYHQVDNSASEYARRPADLDRDLQAIKASGIIVKTIHDAFAEVKPQAR